MRTDIWIDKKAIDLYSDTSIKYTFQINDIANLANRQSSYTDSFNVPKTENNIQIMDGLGLPSDTSRVPYLQPDCAMKHEGFDLIKKGYANITETDDEYHLYLYSGIVNFFKAIENKKLSELDLTEIVHTKDLNSVVGSYLPGSPYRYFIADYNGQTHFLNDPSIINIDYLVPSVNVKYLWDKIHAKFPYTGEIFDTDDFKNLWITYPKAPNISDLYKLVSSGTNNERYTTPLAQYENYNTQHMYMFVNNTDAGSLPWRNGLYLDIPEDGNYKITFEVSTGSGNQYGVLNYWLAINSEGIFPGNITNKINLVTVPVNGSNSREFTMPLAAGTILSLFMKKDFYGGARYIDMTFRIKVEKVNKETVNFQDGLGDFSVTDFTKEVINFFGLTIFPEEGTNKLTYKTIKERVRTDDVIDWSDKYIERTNEEYVATNYSQRNYFQYQYNDKEGSYYDGYIDTHNLNLDASRTVFKSKIYAPERVKTKFKLNGTTEIDSDVFKFYDKQANDDPNKPPTYKGLEKRFYFIRQGKDTYSVKMGSNAANEQQTVPNAVTGDFTGLNWQNIIGKYYGDYITILTDSRLHTISLDLDIVDAIQLDFKKLYYFKQEQQYYLLNKLNYDDRKATGEFIRVKKQAAGSINTGVSIKWIDDNIGSTTTWNHYKAIATPIGNPSPFIWQTRQENGPWINRDQNTLEYDYPFVFGKNELRIQYTSGGITAYSNEISYERKVELDPDKCYRFDFTSLQGLPRNITYIATNGLITGITFTFSSPTEVKSIEAKAITGMGGATLVNQTVIPCPPIVCIRYRTSKFAASGDDLTISYVDCNGETVNETQHGPPGSGMWLEFSRCAAEGTFSTNGDLYEEGPC